MMTETNTEPSRLLHGILIAYPELAGLHHPEAERLISAVYQLVRMVHAALAILSKYPVAQTRRPT